MKIVLSIIISVFVTLQAAWALDDMQLYRAIEMDNLSAIKEDIEKGNHTIDSKIFMPPASEDTPLIVIAVRQDALNTMKYLIEKKADLNAVSKMNETALLLASYFPNAASIGNADIEVKNDLRVIEVNALLAAGANIENVPGAYTPLTYAAYATHNNLNIIEILLAKGANPNGAAVGNTSVINTPLIMATLSGGERVVQTLLVAGADPRIVNAKGRDAMFFAKRDGKTLIIKMLQCALNLKAGESYASVCRF